MSSTSETNDTKHIALASGEDRYALRRRQHTKENEDVACTSSLATIVAVDEAESPASKCVKSDLSSEVHISCSGTLIASPSEHPDIGGLSVDDGALEGTRFTDLPRELMFKIFRYLYEDDLAQCTLVSRKFRAVADHQILWKSLYQEVFEYSFPLLHASHAQFEFREPHESIVVNPWKESFKQLKHGIHVRPGYASLYSGFGAGGRRLTQCDRLDQALQLVKTHDENVEKLIFLHTGLYILEATVTINSDIQIIGASAGPNIASRVIIEGRLTAPVTLAKGSQSAYFGWMTVRFAPDSGAMGAAIVAENLPMQTYHFALQICDNSTALVEHCVIHSSATIGAAVYVHGNATNPKMRHCVVCDCESAGIYVTDAAQGQFEDCEIARNNYFGILVKDRANPSFRRCHIHDGCGAGIWTFDHGMGYFESCDIHNNQLSGIEVEGATNPTVVRCEVHHGQQSGVYVYEKGRGQFMENRIHSNAAAGIAIESHSDPTIRRNEIYNGLQSGVYISDEGRGVLEENEVYGNTLSGIAVTTGSSPIIRKNRIHSGKQGGVYFYDNGQGVLEENDIFNHLLSGVEIKTGSNPKITRNKIRGNQGGVLIPDNGQGVLEDNEIFDNAMYGVWIEADGNPTLRCNKIYDGQGEGVRIHDKGRGILEDNDIYRNALAGVLIMSESNPTLRRNRVYEGRTAGIEIGNGAMGTLESNAIFHNRFGGLFLATGVQPTLCGNRIYDNEGLVEKTIAKGVCLFEITSRTSFAMHDFYRCDTCSTTEEDAICLNCIRTCHAGHDFHFVKYDRFFCDCGAGTLKHKCKLWSEVHDDSAPPVDFELQ